MSKRRQHKVSSDVSNDTLERIRQIKAESGRSLGDIIASGVRTDAIVSAIRALVLQLDDDYAALNLFDENHELRMACGVLLDEIEGV